MGDQTKRKTSLTPKERDRIKAEVHKAAAPEIAAYVENYVCELKYSRECSAYNSQYYKPEKDGHIDRDKFERLIANDPVSRKLSDESEQASHKKVKSGMKLEEKMDKILVEHGFNKDDIKIDRFNELMYKPLSLCGSPSLYDDYTPLGEVKCGILYNLNVEAHARVKADEVRQQRAHDKLSYRDATHDDHSHPALIGAIAGTQIGGGAKKGGRSD
jgi:hypothetical protein